MDSILLPAQLDISKIKFGAVRTNTAGGKSVSVTHNGAPIIMQTPEMISPFGLSKWEKSGETASTDTFKYNLDLGFNGRDERENLNTFYNKMSEFDEILISQGIENSMNWLGKKITSEEVIRELFSPMIRHARDKNTGEITDKYPPTFKLTIPFKDGKFLCDVYGPDKSPADLHTMVTKGSRVTAIVQCVGIWVVGKKYGCSWKVLQMKVVPRSNIPKCAFRDVENDAVKDEHVPAEEVAEDDPELLAESDDELDRK